MEIAWRDMPGRNVGRAALRSPPVPTAIPYSGWKLSVVRSASLVVEAVAGCAGSYADGDAVKNVAGADRIRLPPECCWRSGGVVWEFREKCYSLVFSASSSSETSIRPQYSHTMIFLFWRISNWRCGGMRLKQPPQASLLTVTTASPFLTLERIRE